MMQLVLIRHADPDYANDGITELGRQQAEGLREAYRSLPVDELYTSPMGRARLTAEAVADAAGIEPVTLDWLHELNGNFRDHLWAWNVHGCDVFARDPVFSIENWAGQVEYGEHMQPVARQFYGRFDEFLAGQGYERAGTRYRVIQRHDRVLVLVCHAGVIQTLLADLLHTALPIAYSQFGVDPSSRTILEMEEKDGFGVLRLNALNDTTHADGCRSRVPQRPCTRI